MEIICTYTQSLPAFRFIGKGYGDEDRIDGSFGECWGRFFDENHADIIKANITSEMPWEDNDGYIGLMRSHGTDPFVYAIGMFVPSDTPVPDGFISYDFPASMLGICHLHGYDSELYCHEPDVAEQLGKAGYSLKNDEEGACWYFERYVQSRYTPDENGHQTLDVGFFVEPIADSRIAARRWECKRYCALLVDFPEDLNEDAIGSFWGETNYDAGTIVKSLRSAHIFLTAISNELLTADMTHDDEIAKIFEKRDLLWTLSSRCELHEENGVYSLRFSKPVMQHQKTIRTAPKSYVKAFKLISENGCDVEFYKNGKTASSYQQCDSGIVSFNDPLTALGLYLFVTKLLDDNWSKLCGRSKFMKHEPNPRNCCVIPFYRADMRGMIRSGGYVFADEYEPLAGYSDEMKKIYMMIYRFIKEKHPDCLPARNTYGHTYVSIPFEVDDKHRMLGQIGIGSSEKSFIFYSAKGSKIKELVEREVDLSETRIASSCGDWFHIQNKKDAEAAIQIMDMQAKYNKNAGAAAYNSSL